MTPGEQPFAELDLLLERLCEQQADPDDMRRLNQLLRTSENARRRYLNYMGLHGALHWNLIATEAAESGTGSAPIGQQGAGEIAYGMFPASADDKVAVPCSLDLGSIPASESPPEARPPAPAWKQARALMEKARRKAGYGIAAALLIGLIVAAALLTRSGKTPPATLGATVGAEWESPNGSLATGSALSNDLLELKAGLAEVRFRSGATMIVQGPARFRILDANAANLSLGKLTATVPPEAHGFAIQTSVSRIVDLGTEFGVEMRDDHSMRAEVFRGRVEMHAIAAPPDAAPTMLAANHAIEISSGSLASVPAAPHPERFVRAMTNTPRTPSEDGANYERWLAFSRELRRDPTLVLYYTLDDATTESPSILPNQAVETAGRYDLSLAGPNAPTLGKGRWPDHGSAMDFVSAKQQRLLLEQYPPAPEGRLTVLAWVYARSRPAYASIAKNWWHERHGQFHLGLWPEIGDLSIWTTPFDGSTLELESREGRPFPIGRWCHVAFIVDDTTVRLYRDGVEVAATRSRGLVAQPVAGTLGIGFKPGDDGHNPAPGRESGFWDGRIDELAIFHRALSPAEIRASYDAGRVTP